MYRLASIALFLSAAILPAQEGKPQTNSATFQAARLTCVIGNNEADGNHRAGYNGIFRLTAPEEKESVYVPSVAGINLEFYFDGGPRPDDVRVFFEPRNVPMEFRKLSGRTAELIQPPTPVYKVESKTSFEVKDPYYIDVSYRAIPRRDDYIGGFLGIFWASYINGPLDKSIYFPGGNSKPDAPQWVQFSSQMHGRDSSVRQVSDTQELAMGEDPTSLYRNLSPLRYGQPFYYGRFRDMVLIYIFKPNPYLRFAHSPSGGGRNAAGDDTNPAWDFQLVIPKPQAGKEYGLDMRVVYKPWAGRADVLAEARKWLQGAVQ